MVPWPRGARSPIDAEGDGQTPVQSEKKGKRFHKDMAVDYRDLLKRLAKNPLYRQQVASGQAIMDDRRRHRGRTPA